MKQDFYELKKEPFFWSRLGFCFDPPMLDSKGKQVIFSRDFAKYRKIHDEFRDAGVKYHTTILSSGWVGVNKFDYTLTDEILDALLCDNPDIYYMPRVKLNVPPDWCRENPEDTFVYFNGPRDAEGIKALACTDDHDWFGLKQNGYPVNGGKNDFERPNHTNLGSSIALQSFSSEKWRKDAAEAFRRLMDHIDGTPYAKQIIGYHIGYGPCGETTTWGSWVYEPEHVGDYGISAVKNFRKYMADKYGSIDAALRVLGLDCEEQLLPPAPNVRAGKKERLSDFMFHSGNSLLAADYYEFLSNTNVDSIEYFCRTVKEYNPKFFTGAFYGYTAVAGCCHAGHLAIDRALSSPYIDFLSSPKGYYKCNAGQPGGEQAPAQSIARKKMWLDEIDNKTHIDPRNRGEVNNFFETKTIIWREVCKNLSRGCGFWFMDLGEGSFSSPEIMAEIKKMTEFSKKINKNEHKSISQVLLVKGDVAKRKHSLSRELHQSLEYELQYRLTPIGTPVDFLRVSDLDEIDLSQYKLVVFGDTFYFEEGRAEKILSKMHPNATVVWNYAPGAVLSDFSYDNVKKICGMSVYEKNESATDHPALCIKENNRIEVLERYDSGEARIAQTIHLGRKNILAADPDLGTSDFRRLAEEAGIQLQAPEGVTVYADNRFISFFAGENDTVDIKIDGKTIIVPQKGFYIK